MKKLLAIMALSATTFAFAQCGPRGCCPNMGNPPPPSQGYYQGQSYQEQGHYQEHPVYHQGRPVVRPAGDSYGYYEQGGNQGYTNQAGWSGQGQQNVRTEQQWGNQPAQSQWDKQGRVDSNADQQRRATGAGQQNGRPVQGPGSVQTQPR